MAVRYVTVSWDRLHHDVCMLASRLAGCGPFTGIVAISRGGLVPAAILARELDCRMVETVSVLTYDEEAPGTPRVMKLPVAAGDGAGWLVVDDLVDTGATARLVRALLPGAYFVTIYAKPEGKALVDECVLEVAQDTWLVFPWDVPPDV